jgi:hypothetical protein
MSARGRACSIRGWSFEGQRLLKRDRHVACEIIKQSETKKNEVYPTRRLNEERGKMVD